MSCPDENILLGYLQGVLAEDRQNKLEEHIDQCSTCHAVLSTVVRSAALDVPEKKPHLAPGVMVDHFRIMRLIGRGAMGEHDSLNLQAFSTDYCDLINQVWQELTVTWAAGLPVVRPPPAEHRCHR